MFDFLLVFTLERKIALLGFVESFTRLGALASMARRPLPGVSDVVAGHSRILVLEDLVDHGNVGAIFR